MNTPTNPIRSLKRDLSLRPFIVIWEVTRACQLACLHCRADAITRRDPKELTTAEGKALLDDLASYDRPRPMVVLTGGDPFERPDLAELVAHGTSIGLHMSASPSVTPRLTEPSLVELREAGVAAVSLSVDGATAATHDGFRGIPGVFDATLTAARKVRELGIRLQVNTTVTADNVHELPDVLAWVAQADVSLWSVFFLVPTGRGGALTPLGADEVEEVLHWLHEIAEVVPVKTTEAPHFRRVAIQRAQVAASANASGGGELDRAFPPGPLRTMLRARTQAVVRPSATKPRSRRPPLDVNAGRGFSFIDHHGKVYPSGFLPLVAGDVRDQPFSSIYSESPLLQQLRDPAQLRGRCGICEFNSVCGGSRSHAFAVTGDPLAEDPACSYQPQTPSPRLLPALRD